MSNNEISKARVWQVIGASAVGTMIEWYDFYIFGSLATIISPLFYPGGNDTLALIAYLSTFAPAVPTYLHGTLFAGVYKTPAIYVEVEAVFTHTAPVDAYRGAGRPEAT